MAVIKNHTENKAKTHKEKTMDYQCIIYEKNNGIAVIKQTDLRS
jgi:hypothetical protein